MADDRQQIVWQLHANKVVDDLLRDQIRTGDFLPVLKWTTQLAGCALYAEPDPHGTDTAKEAAVQAWAVRLGLEQRRTPCGDGWVRLIAHGAVERVKVAISTTLYGEEGEEK